MNNSRSCMANTNWSLCPRICPEPLHGQEEGQDQILHVLSLLPAGEHQHEQVAAQKDTAALFSSEMCN